ncbi:MAG: AbgT family transporter, partial [Asticcacaulis sp.]
AAVGRHPIAGIAAAFAGVSGGFSANLFPGQLDALLLGITEPAAELLLPGWDANIAGNWYFIAGMTVFFLPAIWFVTDVIIEPRLKKQGMPEEAQALAGSDADLSASEKKGLLWAGLAILFVVGLWLVLTLGPGTPLIDEAAKPEAQLSPFYKSLVGGFFLLFLLSGWAYGAAAGTVKSHRDIVQMMSESMGTMAYFLVLAFFIAHFVAMFNWSNLGLIAAVNGADFIRSQNMPLPLLLATIVGFTALINILIGSASAKWALMAPILVPMLMLLGVSPEMTTAAYRVGDGITNIITPLMVYFPLILTFCQRWNKDFGLGSLMALMIPYSFALLIFGVALVVGWVYFDWPLGPGAQVHFSLPTQP